MIYDEAFKLEQNDRHDWIIQTLKKSNNFCLKHQKNVLRYLKIAVETQRIFEHCKSDKFIIQEELEKVDKIVKLKVNRLKKHMLNHIYKPSGAMFKKSCTELKDILSN